MPAERRHLQHPAARRTLPSAGVEAPAQVLAMLVAANGRIDERELRAIESQDGFRQLAVSRQRFVELAQSCLDAVGGGLCEHSWLSADDEAYLDRLLDAVDDAGRRRLVCRLGAAVIAADGEVSAGERLVFNHALGRWHIAPDGPDAVG